MMRWMRRTLGTPVVTKQPFNLKNVIDVLSGHMTSEIAYRHATRLLVVSFALPFLRHQSSQQTEIGLSQPPEHL